MKILALTTVDNPKSVQKAKKFDAKNYLVNTLYLSESIEKRVREILGK